MKIKYSETFLFKGTESELAGRLKTYTRDSDYAKALGLHTSSVFNNKFVITAFSSMGVMMYNIGSYIPLGISAYGIFEEYDDSFTIVNIKTRIRPEIYILSVAVFIAYMFMIFSAEVIPYYV